MEKRYWIECGAGVKQSIYGEQLLMSFCVRSETLTYLTVVPRRFGSSENILRS